VAFALALLAGYRDAVDAKVESLYWLAVWLLGSFYAVAAFVFFFRQARRLWQRWTIVRDKAREHDDLSSELERWKRAAAQATAHAEDAERLVATRHLDTLLEGRRRLLAEVRAFTTDTSFDSMECAVDDGVLLVGARWSGEAPTIDSRYVLRSITLKATKAVLEIVALREDRTVVFRVDSVISAEYRSLMISQARVAGAVPSGVEIVPRDEENFGREALWPEN
jgi:hypothetical protein